MNWEEIADGLAKAIEAKDSLLACYRLGRNPSDSLWSRLNDAAEAVGRYDGAKRKKVEAP